MEVKTQASLNVKGRIKFTIGRGSDILYSLRRNNVITYYGADIMARLIGNDSTYVPRHMGFMYGDDPTAASLVDPDTLPASTRRRHTWDSITSDVAGASANVMVAPLILSPAWATDSTDGAYTGNTVTLAASTGTYLEYAFPTTGATYAAAMGDLANVYIYHAILLNRRVVGSTTIYTPFARVTLKDPTSGLYNAKPDGFDASLFWGVTFE